MKNKLIIALILLLSITSGIKNAYAAETMDVPQNTEVQDTVQEDKTLLRDNEESQADKDIKEVSDKKTLKKDDTKKDDKETKDEKSEKTRKFFFKTERAKDDKNAEEQSGPATDVLVDSDSIEYFPERHEFEALGNAKVSFPSENSVLLADRIVFNHDTNYIKGYDNVVLIKEGQKVTGDYIQVNLNEDNAMMTNPVLNHMLIKIRAKQAIVNDAQTEALDGVVTFNEKASYKFISRPVFNFHEPMMDDVIPKNYYL